MTGNKIKPQQFLQIVYSVKIVVIVNHQAYQTQTTVVPEN